MKVGRKTGSSNRNQLPVVYSMMRRNGMLPDDMTKTELMIVLKKVGDKVWDLVYRGHKVAIPGLFNMEIRPNSLKWPRRVDWKRTLKLWNEDEDAKKRKLLVRATPTDHYLRVKHSTIGSKRSWWYYPLMMEIHPCKGKMRQIDNMYTL